MLFEMNVDWVLPIIPGIYQHPVLSRVLRNSKTKLIAVCESVVDYPLAIITVEIEVSRDARRDNRRQGVEGWPRCRIDTVVRNRGANAKLNTIRALAWVEKCDHSDFPSHRDNIAVVGPPGGRNAEASIRVSRY